jgi:hypothetical protein
MAKGQNGQRPGPGGQRLLHGLQGGRHLLDPVLQKPDLLLLIKNSSLFFTHRSVQSWMAARETPMASMVLI